MNKLIVPYTMPSGTPLIPNDIAETPMENWREMKRHMAEVAAGKTDDDAEPDHMPLVKLFMPTATGRWLISQLKPSDPNIAFGLADMGVGYLEIGYIHLPEIVSVKGPLGLGVERDKFFTAEKTLSQYAEQWDKEMDELEAREKAAGKKTTRQKQQERMLPVIARIASHVSGKRPALRVASSNPKPILPGLPGGPKGAA